MRLAPALLLVPLLSGCAQLAPQKVADGVAQLTVRDVGGVMLAVNSDEACGFASAVVNDNPAVSGAIGELGTATWTVENCTIDLGSQPVELTSDCNGVTTHATGQVTVTARKVLRGQVTGDPATPVIPVSPDAVTFHMDRATFADFDVTKTNSGNHMRVIQGSLSAAIRPRLALDDTDGACSVVTPHIAFDAITWGPSLVEVTTPDRTFEVDLRGGTLNAVNGTVGDRENQVEGTLTVWRKTKTVSLSGPTEGLDPDYDRQAMEDSFACREELALPVSYECPLEPSLAEGAARLIVKNFALITKTTDLDTRCGFGNFGEQASELIDWGALGGLLFGTPQTIELNADQCTMGGDPHLIFEDCVGTGYFLDGQVTVTGSKTVTGKIVLDDDPVQPQDRHSAVVVIDEAIVDVPTTPLQIDLQTNEVEPHLTLHTGTLHGTYLPVTGEAADDPGAYFIVIPVGEFEGIRLVDADVTLHKGAMQFPMHVDDSELYAFTGGYLADQNWLYGTVTLDGTTWEIGGAAEPIALDPEYDQAAFDLAYECIENLLEVVPVD